MMLTLYAAGRLALLPDNASHEYFYIPAILTTGAVITFMFGLLVVGIGLRRLLRHPRA